MTNVYPYVVIRWMATVYGQEPVLLEGEGPWSGRGYDLREAYLEAEGDVSQIRSELCRQVFERVKRDGHRRCAVFGPGDAVYVEPDGNWVPSGEIPSGGIGVQKMTIHHPDGRTEVVDLGKAPAPEQVKLSAD